MLPETKQNEKSNKRKKNVLMYVSKWIVTIESDRCHVKPVELNGSGDVSVRTTRTSSWERFVSNMIRAPTPCGSQSGSSLNCQSAAWLGRYPGSRLVYACSPICLWRGTRRRSARPERWRGCSTPTKLSMSCRERPLCRCRCWWSPGVKRLFRESNARSTKCFSF